MTQQSTVYTIADRLVSDLARLDPVLATMSGVAGHDAEMSDYSPEGAEAMRDLGRATLTELDAVPVANDRDRVAKEVMQEVLTHGGGRAS